MGKTLYEKVFDNDDKAKALGLTYDQLRHCIKKHGLMEQEAG